MSYTIKPNKTKTLVYTHKGREYRVRGEVKEVSQRHLRNL